MESSLKSLNSSTNRKSATESNKSRNHAKLSPIISYLPKRRGVYVERQMSFTKSGLLGPIIKESRKENAPPPKNRKRAASPNYFTNANASGSVSVKSNKITNSKTDNKTLSRKIPSKFNKADVGNKMESKVKKSKYKSQALSKPDKECVVLQSKKDLILTPSNYSGYTTDTLVGSEHSRIQEKQQNALHDIIFGAKNLKEAIDNPVTLVSQSANNNNNDKLYHFFMDLLENTLSDVETEQLEAKSQVNFEIEDDVVKKLEVENNEPQLLQEKAEPNFIGLDDNQNFVAEYFLPKVHVRKGGNLLTPKWKNLGPQKQKQIPQTQSWDIPKKRVTAKTKRRQLLNSLKYQLRMDLSTYEEPKTIYESLKMLARDKKRRQKFIHFDVSDNDENTGGCIFKRSHLLGKKVKKNAIDSKQNDVATNRSHPSDHSLKVYDVSNDLEYLESDVTIQPKTDNFKTYFSSDSSFDARQ